MPASKVGSSSMTLRAASTAWSGAWPPWRAAKGCPVGPGRPGGVGRLQAPGDSPGPPVDLDHEARIGRLDEGVGEHGGLGRERMGHRVQTKRFTTKFTKERTQGHQERPSSFAFPGALGASLRALGWQGFSFTGALHGAHGAAVLGIVPLLEALHDPLGGLGAHVLAELELAGDDVPWRGRSPPRRAGRPRSGGCPRRWVRSPPSGWSFSIMAWRARAFSVASSTRRARPLTTTDLKNWVAGQALFAFEEGGGQEGVGVHGHEAGGGAVLQDGGLLPGGGAVEVELAVQADEVEGHLEGRPPRAWPGPGRPTPRRPGPRPALSDRSLRTRGGAWDLPGSPYRTLPAWTGSSATS